MPAPTKRKLQLKNARSARHNFKRPCGPFGVRPDPPIDNFYLRVHPKKCPGCKNCHFPRKPETKRRRLDNPEKTTDQQPTDTIRNLERRWKAVSEVREALARRKLTRQRCDVIIQQVALDSGMSTRTLHRLVAKSREEGSLAPEQRRRNPEQRRRLAQFIAKTLRKPSSKWTTRALAAAARARLGFGSPSSVWRTLKSQKFRKVAVRHTPLLSHAVKRERLAWANEILSAGAPAAEDVLVHVDEKWFFSFTPSSVWVPSSSTALPCEPVVSLLSPHVLQT